MTLQEFQQSIREGIPAELPAPKPYDPEVNHAPKRKDILTKEEKKLAIRNALRYFEPRHHAVLAREFAEELEKYVGVFRDCNLTKEEPILQCTLIIYTIILINVCKQLLLC